MPRISDIDQKPESYMHSLREFIKKPVGYFLIAGSNGNGKTFTAQALHECYRYEKLFISQTELNLKWQQFQQEWGQTLYLLDQISRVKFLVIDDLGTRTPTEAFMDFLYAISDRRYNQREECATIITTNLNSKSMRDKFGDAFVSRICSGIVIRHDGSDRRFINF